MPVLTKINSNVIADDAITGDMLGASAYLANTATQNISGTYSENRLYTSDAYTLSGNATVNSHLTLSSVKPTADVVLTAGGAYTLTGTGVLSGGSLLAKTPSLTGMTGELGSGVTFPAGHIVQVVEDRETAARSTSSTSLVAIDSNFVVSLTTKQANSKILVQGQMTFGGSDTGLRWGFHVYRKIASGSYSPVSYQGDASDSRIRGIAMGVAAGTTSATGEVGFSFLDAPAQAAGTLVYYQPYWMCENSSYTIYLNRHHGDANSASVIRAASSIIISEVAQ